MEHNLSSKSSLKLNTGKELSILGLGTWKSQPGEVYAAVKTAIEVGYRHIDGAWVYGNEAEVGKAINEKINDGTIKRDEIFLTGKSWNTYHRKDLVKVNLDDTLKKLKLDYLDLYLMHWPMAYKEGGEVFPKDEKGKTQYSSVHFKEAWEGLEELFHQGLVKAIGVSNFNVLQLKELLSFAKVKPSVVQVELHPYLPQKDLINFCHSNGIVVTAYSPLGSPDRPPAMVGTNDPELLQDPVVKEIAKKHNKNAGQVLIRYHIQNGNVVIPKSAKPERIRSNFEVFDFALDENDFKELDKLASVNFRACNLKWVNDHPLFPHN